MTRTVRWVVVLLIAMVAGCATAPPGDERRTPREPHERMDYLHEAVRASEARRYDQAIELLLRLQATEQPEDAATTHYLLGSAYAGLGDYAGAATHYTAAVDTAGDMTADVLAMARLGAGHYSFLAGRYEEAVRHLSAWRDLTAAPHPDTLQELALALSRTGANDDAIAVAERVVGESDEATLEPVWFEMLADFYYDNGQYTESLKARDRAEARRLAVVLDSAPVAKPSERARARRERALPDTQTLRELQAQTRALLAR